MTLIRIVLTGSFNGAARLSVAKKARFTQNPLQAFPTTHRIARQQFLRWGIDCPSASWRDNKEYEASRGIDEHFRSDRTKGSAI
jgi:hypothetical protein